jgi:hypothetical protein
MTTSLFNRRCTRLLLVVGLLVASLFVDVMHLPTVSAQTGAPPPADEPVITPPAGATVIQPLFPAIPPPGVPAVTEEGLLAVLPPAENAVAVLTLVMGDIRTTLIVPTEPDISIAVRIQPNDGSLPQPLPDTINSTLATFTLDLYNAENGTPINNHTPPLTFGAALAPGIAPSAVLFRYNETTGAYETISLSADSVTGVVRGEISATSPFLLATGNTVIVVPDGLPNTGDAARTLPVWSLVVLVGSVGVVWWFRHWFIRSEHP